MGKNLSSTGNIEIRCIHCGETFVFSKGEQEYYQNHSLVQPRRCKKCRKLHIAPSESSNGSPYAGLTSMLPGFYKGNFKGGIDVTDISGWKWRPKYRTNYC